VIGVAVSSHDDLCVLSTEAHLEHSDFLDVFTCADTSGAENTRAHVVLDHHVARALIAGAKRQLVMGPDRHVVLDDVTLELVPGTLTPPVCQVLAGITLEQEIQDASPVLRGGG